MPRIPLPPFTPQQLEASASRLKEPELEDYAQTFYKLLFNDYWVVLIEEQTGVVRHLQREVMEKLTQKNDWGT